MTIKDDQNALMRLEHKNTPAKEHLYNIFMEYYRLLSVTVQCTYAHMHTDIQKYAYKHNEWKHNYALWSMIIATTTDYLHGIRILKPDL